ncbi:Dynein assembly factor 1, axonemal [Hondaea fermentalgiana]|uniref:Dynein assembly factor 1, axonemal n=1 Tax=Hondaea fermentalgiana TaxID=2315210 RepID=A0A2R5GSR0_9STRA|nr:Dynein assembly factor 1, axonemal [Hondaea fermentalgiana]|eukprot:GBG33349.1 Dynein assembly factor 1, axonemal [Hondaea fermentalgiana]
MVGVDMTKLALRESCEKNKLYRTPRLNDKLYLHYKGWKRIENLDEYTGLKVLWLEGNGLLKIEGLEHQKELRTLYLHENVLEKIENLENQANLDTLNLAQNFIEKIENLEHMKELKTLLLPQNRLKELANIEHVTKLPELSCLDIQKNKIEDPAILDVLERCEKLSVLYLQGNPCVKKIRFYRKTTIARLKSLKYLDDRPVFPEERLRAEAWCRGLAEGSVEAARACEKAELDRQRKEKQEKEEANFRAFEKMMLDGKRIRAEREAAAKAAAAAAASAPGSETEAGPVAAAPVAPPVAPPVESTSAANATATPTDASMDHESAPAMAMAAPPVPPPLSDDATLTAQVPAQASPVLVNPYSGEKVIKRPENPASKAFREDKLRRAQARADNLDAAETQANSSQDEPASEQTVTSSSDDDKKEQDSISTAKMADGPALQADKVDGAEEEEEAKEEGENAASPLPAPTQTVPANKLTQNASEEDSRREEAAFDELD